MAKRKHIIDESEQMELIPECSDESKKKLRTLLAQLDSLEGEKKTARDLYNACENAVIVFVRDEEGVMPDQYGNYRIRLDAEETICISHGKSKVKVKREKRTDDAEDQGEDTGEAGEG